MQESAGPTEAIKNYCVELRRARKMFASGEHMAAFMIMVKAAGHLAEHLDVDNEDLGAPAIALYSDLVGLYDGQQTEYLRPHMQVSRGRPPKPSALQALQALAAYILDHLMHSGFSKDESAKAVAAAMKHGSYGEQRNTNIARSVMYWHEQCTGAAAKDNLQTITFKRLRKSKSLEPIDRESPARGLRRLPASQRHEGWQLLEATYDGRRLLRRHHGPPASAGAKSRRSSASGSSSACPALGRAGLTRLRREKAVRPQ